MRSSWNVLVGTEKSYRKNGENKGQVCFLSQVCKAKIGEIIIFIAIVE